MTVAVVLAAPVTAMTKPSQLIWQWISVTTEPLG
jgi:hypothetical protein